jgi:hypothetical protein
MKMVEERPVQTSVAYRTYNLEIFGVDTRSAEAERAHFPCRGKNDFL